MRLKNKTALITGASRGIGKATALTFAREGANIVVDYFVSDIEPNAESNANNVVKEIENCGSKAIAIEADVSNEEHVKNLVLQAIKTFGKIDILVNNAGIVFDLPLSERTVEHWRNTLNVNLIGCFLCTKYVIPHLKKSGDGRIINISSTNAINAFSIESIDYDSAKAGVILLTKNLSKELAPHKILVNAVAPGWVDTPMNKNLPKDFVEEETEKIYLKRFARPEEISKAILFLASEESSYITGSILKIDGGYS